MNDIKTKLKIKHLQASQWIALAIPIVFLCSVCLGRYVQRFRGSSDYRWIYEYGSMVSMFIEGICVLSSLINAIVIFEHLSGSWLKRTLWILISAALFLFVIGLAIFAMRIPH